MKRAARVVIPDLGWVPVSSSEPTGQAVPLDWDTTLRTIHHGARRPHGRRAAAPSFAAARARIRSMARTPLRPLALIATALPLSTATSDERITPEGSNKNRRTTT